MTVFDAHCDTISKILDGNKMLEKNDCMLDLERMSRYDGYVQVFAAFVDKRSDACPPLTRALSLIDRLYTEAERNEKRISVCTSYAQIRSARRKGKVAALISVEGGEAIEGRLENLRSLYRLGVRMMTLTWNYANELCDGIGEPRGGGLTEFGGEVVDEMNRLGMIVDVSHLSEKGFWDVIERSSAPICASHSDAKAICGHRRNLTDEQIRALIDCGGCIGVNFYPEFVAGKECGITEVIGHIEHILELGGEGCVGLGSDFDGIDSTPLGLGGVEGIHTLIEELLRIGYSERLVKRIAAGNFLRLVKTVIG